MSIGLGNSYSWTSPTIPLLMSEDSPLPINLNTASLIASLYLIGAAISPFFASTVSETFGFKRSFVLFTLLSLTSLIFLASTWTVYALYFGRFLSGFVAGMIYLTFPLYISEVTEDSLRSSMNALPLLFRCFGILMEFAIGPSVSYHVLILINSITPILYLLSSPWMPESPYYLVTKGRKEDAVRTVAWLRGGIPTASAEIITNRIEVFIEQANKQKKSFKDLVGTRGNVRGLLITTTLLALQQLSGATVMLVYTEQLFEMTGPGFPASTSALIYGVVYLIGSGFGPIFAKQWGFRKPLIISGIVIFLAEFVLGLYLYCYENGVDVSKFTYCPIFCVLVYAATFNFALGSTPWAIMGEVFPPNIKGHAASLSTTVCFTFAFMVTQSFPILSQLIHTYNVFWIFAVSSIMVSVFTAIFVPNTKGLSLDQIQEKLNKIKHSQERSEKIDLKDRKISIIA